MNINRRQFAEKFGGMFAAIPFFPLLNKKDNKTKLTPSLRDQWFDDERIIKQIKIDLNRPLTLAIAGSEAKLCEYKFEDSRYIYKHQQTCVAQIEKEDLDKDNIDQAFDSIFLSLYPFILHISSIEQNTTARSFKYLITDDKINRHSFNEKELIHFDLILLIYGRGSV